MKNREVLLIPKAFAIVWAVSLSINAANAAVVFEAGFRGPGGGRGGAYDMVSYGGTGSMDSQYPGRFLMSVQGEDPLDNSGGYMQCEILDVVTSYTRSISTFTPAATTNSLDAMTDLVGGDRVLKGGFDFFFRCDTAMTGSEMRALDNDNRGNKGLRIVFTSQSPGLRLEMISYGILSGSDSGSSNTISVASGAFTFTSNTVYHLGVTFETDIEGTVTAKIWGQEGSGAIDLLTATPVASTTFGIDEDVATSGFSTGAFSIGQIRSDNIPVPMTQAYDQFRIYDETPLAFGALGETSVTWRDSSPETVLQADFNGPGNGTAGDNDIVTFGGTATLVDAGTYSDASVIDTDPFKSSGPTSSGGYMCVLTTNNVTTGIYGRTSITPSSTESALSSMTVITNGHIVLRGGLDFFFRNTHDIEQSAEFRPIDTDNRGSGGLRLVLYNANGTQLRLEVIANNNGLYDGGEGGSLKTSFAYDFISHISSNTLYHVGISFDSTDDGTVTAAVWLKEGTGEINLRQDVPVGSLSFGINEAVVSAGFTTGSFNLGKLSGLGAIPSTQDYDCLRVYNDTPLVFSALPVPPPGTIILIQ